MIAAGRHSDSGNIFIESARSPQEKNVRQNSFNPQPSTCEYIQKIPLNGSNDGNN